MFFLTVHKTCTRYELVSESDGLFCCQSRPGKERAGHATKGMFSGSEIKTVFQCSRYASHLDLPLDTCREHAELVRTKACVDVGNILLKPGG